MNGLRVLTHWHELCRSVVLLVAFAVVCCGQSTSVCAERPNVLLLCIDDLRPELHCYGVDYIQSPHIDALAAEGILFKRHYVQAPTCGASRFALLTGRYGGRSNNAIFERAARMKAGEDVPPSMPAWFRQLGYKTISVGKVSHHPGGRGGPDWDDDNEIEMPDAWDQHLCPSGDWQHPRGFMHGLANGEIRTQSSKMDVLQSKPGDDAIYPDGLTTDEALRQLKELAANKQQPFFLAVGLLRPHLPFGSPAKYMDAYRNANLPPIPHPEKPTGKTTWHDSAEFMSYNRWGRNPNQDPQFATDARKHYAACVSYADAQVGRIVEQLKAVGASDNTIIVLWGDHGWHLGEHAIWGKHSLFEESLRSPLVIRFPKRIESGRVTQTIAQSIDIFPTLCDLASLSKPTFAQGSSLLEDNRLINDTERAAISYFKQARTIRNDTHRLIVHKDGHRELYDHIHDPGECQNVAEKSVEMVAEMLRVLDARYPEQ